MTQSPETGQPPRGHRSRWFVVAIVVGVVGLIVLGAVGLAFLNRYDPGGKDLDEAIEEFRTGTTEGGEVLVSRPDAGVYLAQGAGREALSLPPVDQDDSDQIPVTIAHLPDGCWEMTVDFNEAHWQSWEYCPGGTALLEQGGQTFQRWELGVTTVENLTEFVCDPPSVTFDAQDEPGASHAQSCQGSNSQVSGFTTSAGSSTYLGPEQMVIGGQSIDVHHYRDERSITGAQTGSSTTETWISAETGLPVRMERTTGVDTDSPFGSISYTEEGWWELTALDPAR